MRIPEIKEAIKAQYRAGPEDWVSIFMQGKPGIGKSDAAKGAAEELAVELGLPFVYMHGGIVSQPDAFHYAQLQATIEEPITLSGLPGNDPDDAHFAIFKAFRDKLPTCGRGIMELAEINTAPPMVQAGLYRLILEGKLGPWSAPPGWYFVATGNRDEDRAATQRIPMPLIGRWCRILAEDDLNAWSRWALAHGVDPIWVAFLQWRPELFNTFDPAEPKPYSCARTITMAARLSRTMPRELERESIAGVIGDGVMTEAMAFIEMARDLVKPEEIIADPEKARVPSKPDTLFAVAGALSAKATAGNFAAVATYLSRIPNEYAVLCVKLAIRRDAGIQESKAFIQWAVKHNDLFDRN